MCDGQSRMSHAPRSLTSAFSTVLSFANTSPSEMHNNRHIFACKWLRTRGIFFEGVTPPLRI